MLPLGHLLPIPPACRGEEESRSTTARPEVTVFTRFLPKPTEMIMQEGFSLGAFISAALVEQTERDHQVPVTAVGKDLGDQVSVKLGVG